MIHDSIQFVYFGTPKLSAEVLEYLRKYGLVPSLIVTNPDRPQGRNMVVTPPPVKLWAIENNIPCFQPENLLDPDFLYKLKTINYKLFVVVAYGKIIPKEILKIPEKGSLNIHYSLLPKYRGASPIESTILNDDKDVGVSILLIDEKMDHGLIIAMEKMIVNWPIRASELRSKMNKVGSELLARKIMSWANDEIKTQEQDHSLATYTKKFIKLDGLLDLNDDPYKNYLKFLAFDDSIGTYFFVKKNNKQIRVLITNAKFEDGKLIITSIIPEGKAEMTYEKFLQNIQKK